MFSRLLQSKHFESFSGWLNHVNKINIEGVKDDKEAFEKIKNDFDHSKKEYSFKKVSKFVEGDVLDIGTEYSSFFDSILQQTNAKSVKGVNIANIYENSNVKNDSRFTFYDGVNLPFKDETFDTITIFMVLHHIKSNIERLKLLKEINRVLKSNGKLIIKEHYKINKEKDNFIKYEHAIYDYIIHNIKPIVYEDYNYINLNTIKNMGFKEIKRIGRENFHNAFHFIMKKSHQNNIPFDSIKPNTLLLNNGDKQIAKYISTNTGQKVAICDLNIDSIKEICDEITSIKIIPIFDGLTPAMKIKKNESVTLPFQMKKYYDESFDFMNFGKGQNPKKITYK